MIGAEQKRLEFAQSFTRFGENIQATLQSSDLNDAASLLEDVISSLEAFEGTFAELEPPAEARNIHERQIALISDLTSAERELLAALRNEDLIAMAAASQRFVDLSAEGSWLSADWNEQLITALSR